MRDSPILFRRHTTRSNRNNQANNRSLQENNRFTMNRFSAIALFALLTSANAFTVAPSSVRTTASPRSTQLNIMTQEETEAVLSKADDCVEGECSIDDVTELIAILKEQQKDVYDRLTDIKASIKSLEYVNQSEDRKVDEVRDTVRALFRVFQLGDKASGNNYPALSKPTGWSGEVGDGPKTAYDALPPKPYKAEKK